MPYAINSPKLIGNWYISTHPDSEGVYARSYSELKQKCPEIADGLHYKVVPSESY